MRELDTTPRLVVGAFRDRAAAEHALAALRADGHGANEIVLDDQVPRHPTGKQPPRRGRVLMLAGAGAAGAIALEATVLAVPSTVPTLAGGSLLAAAIGGIVGMAAGLSRRTEAADAEATRLIDHVRRGDHLLSVCARSLREGARTTRPAAAGCDRDDRPRRG